MKKLIAAAALALVMVPAASFAAETPTTQVVPVNTTTGGAQVQQNNGGSGSASLSACADVKSGAGKIVSCIVGAINTIVYLIMAVAVAYIVWGAFKLMQEEGRDEGKNIIMYGIIGLFVMVSIWGLVNILLATFGTGGQTAAQPPQLVTPR